MIQFFIGLGSNLRQPKLQLDAAVANIQSLKLVWVNKVSEYFLNPAVGGPLNQADYLNAVLVGKTQLSAVNLLEQLLMIEHKQGRLRTIDSGPRTLDLDLLLFGHERIKTPFLTVPHPRMLQRVFVLKPFKELLNTYQYQQWLKFIKN